MSKKKHKKIKTFDDENVTGKLVKTLHERCPDCETSCLEIRSDNNKEMIVCPSCEYIRNVEGHKKRRDKIGWDDEYKKSNRTSKGNGGSYGKVDRGHKQGNTRNPTKKY